MNDAFDIVGKTDGVEIHEKPELFPGHPQISQDLGVMYREECAYGFEFNHQRILHKQIDSISIGDLKVLVGDGKEKLPDRRVAAKFEFVLETRLIGAFQQSRSEIAMDLDRSADDFLRQII